MSPFEYRKATDDQVDKMRDLSQWIDDVYQFLVAHVASSAERTLAIRKLQEARMWANVAILGIELPR